MCTSTLRERWLALGKTKCVCVCVCVCVCMCVCVCVLPTCVEGQIIKLFCVAGKENRSTSLMINR